TSRLIVANGEDENIKAALEGISVPVTTFGIGCDFEARDIKAGNQTEYTLYYKGTPVCPVTLPVPGMHNVNNSLAALAGAHALGISLEEAATFLADFCGAKRRFEYKGNKNGIDVYDDYAHHPTEIEATLKAAKQKEYNRMWCIFQPHTYTRTKALFDEFVTALSKAENVIIADIYAAREPDTGLVHSSQLAQQIPGAIYLSTFSEIKQYLDEHTKSGDMVMTIGAGTIYQAGELFLK
ncbi:MAG: UDP-N-acetylmuramate--L-alanine ligase, partial [Ruminococcaceae bacterium]|nr:UDP-N-acetylmuramate--L-alanine ligase [Oscillospiraceae bacterium]